MLHYLCASIIFKIIWILILNFSPFKQRIEFMGIMMKNMVWELLHLVKWRYHNPYFITILFWKSLSTMKVKLFCPKFFCAVTLFFNLCDKGFLMVKSPVHVSNRSVFNAGTIVEYTYRLHAHTGPLHALCLRGIKSTDCPFRANGSSRMYTRQHYSSCST